MAIRIIKRQQVGGRWYEAEDIATGLSADQERALVQGGDAAYLSGNTSSVPALIPAEARPLYMLGGLPVQGGGLRGGVVAADAAGRPRDAYGRPLKRLAAADVAATTIWFPLQEGSGNRVYDGAGQLVGALGGGSSGQRWGQAPGLSFNGSNNRVVVTDGLQAGFTASARHVCNIASLVSRGDMLLVWCVISHPATLPADSWFVSWGMNADPAGKGGWAVGLKATSGKLQFAHRPKGGNATVVTPMGVTGARGQDANNTRTAVCMEICASGVSGLLEIRGYQLTLGTDGGNAQSNVGLDTPALVPNGTGAVAADTSQPLTIGAWPDTSGSTWVGFVGPNMALINLGLQRRPLQLGLGMQICRDLRDDIGAFPASAR